MLHLVPNCSAAGSMRQAFPQAKVYSARDALSCGPARELTAQNIDAWFAERAAFWAPIHPWTETSQERSEILDQLRRQDGADCAVWAGSTCDDQLFLAWVCAVAPLLGDSRIHTVDCTLVPNRHGKTFPISTVSILSSDDLRRAPEPQLLPPDQIALYANAWHAWAAPSPEKLLTFIQQRHGTPISTALSDLLNRYPLAGRGINHPELLLLANIRARGPAMVRAIGWTLGDRMDPLGIGSAIGGCSGAPVILPIPPSRTRSSNSPATLCR
jgi:hypothetical protein